MYIVINTKTYRLKELNAIRKNLFIEKILQNYNYNKDFDAFALDVQNELKEKYQIEISLEKIKKDFFKEYDKAIYLVIWEFIKDEDKKEIGVWQNLNIEAEQKIKFIELICAKIKEYADLANSDNGVKTDIMTIYTYVAKTFGWHIEDIIEMDELTLLKVLEEAVDLNKKERAENVNLSALATAYAGGNKSAKSQIEKINREARRVKIDYKKMELTQKAPDLSRDEIKRLMRNGG